MNTYFFNKKNLFKSLFVLGMFVCTSVSAQQTAKFIHDGREINLPPGAKFNSKRFKYIDYSEKLGAPGKEKIKKNFMSDFSKEDINNFKTKYQKDYKYYQEALAYFNKLSDRVNKIFTVDELWYIYVYDQELKNKLLYF